MIPLRNLIKPFLKVGLFGFGGGAGMLAILRNECVRKQKLISDEELATAVAIGQMLPGPFVPNYCEYIGYRLAGIKGAIVSGTALLLPSFILMLILSYLYFIFHTIPVISQIFKGIGAVMTAIIIWASYDMGRVLIKDLKGILIFLFTLILFLAKFDPVLTVLLAGALNIILEHFKSPKLLFATPVFLFDLKKALELFLIFFKIGAVIFGGGYAAIPFIQKEVCIYRNWLNGREFLDGFALGQITPGPVAITATFVGFKVMGIPGAFISTIGIFLPSFLMLILLVKIYKRIENKPYVRSFFNGVKSAVVAILLSTGIFFIPMNWSYLPYGILGVFCLLLLIFLKEKIEPIFLILVGIFFSLIFR
uniref:Chromate efflux transporter n=1 Tax=candidate division WOR-3 bacterium TaxID=2052148 RepID=A0A7C4TBN2_UNCW3